MAITVSGTTITFNDGSTQSTAASGTGVPSTLLGVGATNILASSYSSALSVGSTLSGSYLFYYSININNPGNIIQPSGNRVNATSGFSTTFNGAPGTATVVGTGTWMLVGYAGLSACFYDSCNNQTNMNTTLWRRIS